MPRVVVYLRFPYPRNGQEDPEIVNWDEEKERELWSLLKAQSNKVEWAALARRFDVPVVYILQQAAWLYQKELKTLQERMTQIRHRPLGDSGPASRQTSEPPPDLPVDIHRSFDSLGSDDMPSARRLMSASQMHGVGASSLRNSEDSMDAFVPQAWSTTSQSSLPTNEIEAAIGRDPDDSDADAFVPHALSTASQTSDRSPIPETANDQEDVGTRDYARQPPWITASQASVPGLTSSSDNSVSRSALEEALMNRLGSSR